MSADRGSSQSQNYHRDMPTFQAFHATIRTDGEDLPEYDVQVDDNEKQVSCWIPSEAGKVSTAYCSVCVLTDLYSELFNLLVHHRVPHRSLRICVT
jgi:hypothetical protein